MTCSGKNDTEIMADGLNELFEATFLLRICNKRAGFDSSVQYCVLGQFPLVYAALECKSFKYIIF